MWVTGCRLSEDGDGCGFIVVELTTITEGCYLVVSEIYVSQMYDFSDCCV